MVKILDEILKELPEDKITSVEFEAANIVIYTSNKDFLFNGRNMIRKIVQKFKKRIELRADLSLLLDEKSTKEEVGKILKDVKLGDFKFDSARSKLVIEVDNVGSAVGRDGSNLKQIQKKTMWSVVVRRIPPIRSHVVDAMRAVEYQESEYRRKFLNKVGKRIYGGWVKGKVKGWSRVTVLGAGNQIGRSAIYLQTSESRVLFDCGIDPAVPFGDVAEFPYLDSPDFKLEDVDAIVISHAHMDHCGLLPYIYKLGYKGPVYATDCTRDIMALSQVDYIKISSSNPGVKPLYKVEDIKEMLKHVITLDYGEVTDITPDLRLTFYNAGHILGSAFCHVNIGNGQHNFMYTGDFNYSYKQRLLNQATSEFPRLESLMMDATSCGPKDYSMPRQEAEEELLKIFIDAYVKKGKVLIPVFGIGRSQEMLLVIESFIKQGRLPEDLDVFIDGMVWEVNAIHTAYPEYLHRNLKARILKGDNPFLIDNFKQIASAKERENVFNSTKPAIVLATSGMMNGGTSVEYFKKFAPNENNKIVFVGYQASGTLGRRIKDGQKEILFSNTGSVDDKVQVKMEVCEMHGAFSGHSDLGSNKRYLANLSVKPKKIMLIHGEIAKMNFFSGVIKKMIPFSKIYTPENLESIRLE
ncbi:MAG: beta-CASP ribonuclease aCPSF1 [Nanoarchaeota archaeon]